MTVRDLLALTDASGPDVDWKSQGSPMLTTLIQELLRRGLDLAVFTCDEALEGHAAPWHLLQGRHLRLYIVPRRRRAYGFSHGRPGRIVDLFAQERRCLQAALVHERPALVHAHWSYEYAAAAQTACPHTLVTCHDSPRAMLRVTPDLYRVGRYLMARHVLGRAWQVSVVSPYLADELRGWLRCEPDLVPNPIPEFILRQGGARLHPTGAPNAPLIAMVLNGWGPHKNAIPGLQAMLSIRQRYPGAELHLVGPGYGAGEQAWAWARDRGNEVDFHFHGACSHEQAIAWLGQASALIHPSLEESFGLSIAEAMALGVPVVAGRSAGAVPWVTGGQAGALVDVRQPAEISDAVLHLLADPIAYATASAGGRRRVEELFSSGAVADRYLQLYRRMAPTRSPLLASLPT